MNIFSNKYSLAILPAVLLLVLPGIARAHDVGGLVFYALLLQFIIVLSPVLAVFLKFSLCKRGFLKDAGFSLKPFFLVMGFEMIFALAFLNAFLSYTGKDFNMRILNVLSYLSTDAVFLYFQKAVIEHDFPWSLISKFLILFFALSLFNFFPNYVLISRYGGKHLNIDRRWGYSYLLSIISPAICCLALALPTLPAQHREAKQYRTARAETVNMKNELLRRAAAIGFLRLVGVAISEGADVNTPERNSKETALHEAVKARGNAKTVKILLQMGADVNRKNSYEFTPLMIACSRSEAEPEVIHLLIKNGADVNAQSLHGETALKIASRRNKGVWAEKYGVKGTKIEKLLLDYGADVNLGDKNGATALMAASEARNAELVKLLLDHGAEVNIQDIYGKTAYMLTSDSAIKEILSKHGAHVS